MPALTLLVTGATGSTGRETTQLLLQRGHHVRALVHHSDQRAAGLAAAGAEIVHGDLLDFASVRQALDGVHSAYFVFPIRPGIVQATGYFAQAAKECGLRGVVNMSQISSRRESHSHAARDHWIAEQVFNWSGLPVTHLRPTFFAEWLLYLAPMIRLGALQVPFGSGRHAPITAADQARVIAAILENPEAHRGQVYPLFGAAETSYAEIADLLSRVLGRPIRYQHVDFERFIRLFGAHSGHAADDAHEADAAPDSHVAASFLAQHLREVAQEHQQGLFAGTNDLVARIGGQAPMPLAEFIERHRDAFA